MELEASTAKDAVEPMVTLARFWAEEVGDLLGYIEGVVLSVRVGVADGTAEGI